MSIFLCDEDGDLAITDNKLSLTDGIQETLQLIRNNLKFLLGEEPLAPDKGLPYIQQILQKGTPISTSSAIIKQAIADTPGVIEVTEFSLTVDVLTRQGTVQFTAQSAAGPIVSTESFP